jgi:hypothetical protein
MKNKHFGIYFRNEQQLIALLVSHFSSKEDKEKARAIGKAIFNDKHHPSSEKLIEMTEFFKQFFTEAYNGYGKLFPFYLMKIKEEGVSSTDKETFAETIICFLQHICIDIQVE